MLWESRVSEPANTIRHRTIHANTLIYVGMYSQVYPLRGIFRLIREDPINHRGAKCKRLSPKRSLSLLCGYKSTQHSVYTTADRAATEIEVALMLYVNSKHQLIGPDPKDSDLGQITPPHRVPWIELASRSVLKYVTTWLSRLEAPCQGATPNPKFQNLAQKNEWMQVRPSANTVFSVVFPFSSGYPLPNRTELHMYSDFFGWKNLWVDGQINCSPLTEIYNHVATFIKLSKSW